MLVFGDQREFASPEERLSGIDALLRRAAMLPAGLDRHSALVAALIEAGRLLQGLADAEFAGAGEDRRSPTTDELSRLLMDVSQAVVRSWDSRFAEAAPLPPLPRIGAILPRIELSVPEGYAFYALYPEAYIDAARMLALAAPPQVIGIRSIGASLAPIVAAALSAPPPVTVRPIGDPFARTIAIAPELERELLDGDAHYLIVDEGPGQSGSSFGAIADWLQERGVPLARIAFLPSHDGAPGPQASTAHRARWAIAQRVAADLGSHLPAVLSDWVRGLLGTVEGPLDDLSAGAWRGHVFQSEEDWPAVHAMGERRKFLATVSGERFLLKFAGLGAIGERKLSMARALHAAGLSAEPIGLVHGFLIERWCGDARLLHEADQPLAEIARYIAARARLFPADRASGASIEQLLAMSRRNIGLALGEEAAARIGRWQQRLDALSRRVVRIRTDNKLDRHEWLRTPSGRLIKTDALDHHCGHDLIGCQDMAWDVAGAIVEFDLDGGQPQAMIAAAERASGRAVDPELLEFYALAYAAFRLGQAQLSRQMAPAGSAEARRLQATADRYANRLQHLLVQCTRGATRPESSVG